MIVNDINSLKKRITRADEGMRDGIKVFAEKGRK